MKDFLKSYRVKNHYIGKSFFLQDQKHNQLEFKHWTLEISLLPEVPACGRQVWSAV
jgi:hypothetical protein